MQNQLNKGLLFIFFILIFLSAYPYLHEKIPFLQKKFKQTESFSFLKTHLSKDDSKKEVIIIRNQIAFIENFQDEAALRAYMDSVDALKRYTGSQTGLIQFFQALMKTENNQNGTTRIAYFGDSMIEGDLITMSLRKWFQRDFGGRGIGFMPVTSITNGFRTNIKHEYSQEWLYSSLVKGNKTSFPFGISGEIFSVDSGTTSAKVTYSARNSAYLEDFPIIKLFYGKGDSTTIGNPANELVYNGEKFLLEEKSQLNTLLIQSTPVKKAEFEFSFNHAIPVYGISIESEKGVLLDNYSSRGSSGMPLSSINQSMIKSFNEEMDCDLVVLQFGLNVLSGKANYVWYKNGMKRVINHFKTAMPNASVLVVGVADKSSKNEEGNMETDVAVPLILDAQREAARESEVAFFDLYEAMGGKNSMIKWVEELEYANKDYTHFNFKGADMAASYIYTFLMEEYKIFKSQMQNENVQ